MNVSVSEHVRSRVARAAIVMFLASMATVAGCGTSDSGGPGIDTAAPRIVAWSPSAGEIDVGLVERIEIAFSEPMDPATISDATIIARGRAPYGHVEYDHATWTATVTPDTLFAPGVPHAVIVDDVIDLAGNALAGPDTSHFTTGPLDCDHLVDHLEPNGTTLDAPVVETGRRYRALTLCGNDRDVFRFSLAEGAMVTARTTIRHADGVDWRLRFIGVDGVPYAAMGGPAATGEVKTLAETFPAGTYYIDVGSDDEPFFVLYELEVEATSLRDR